MKPFTTLAVIVLVLVATVHAVRLWLGSSIIVDGSAIPMWASIAGAALALVLAIGVWHEATAGAGTQARFTSQFPATRGPGTRFTVQQGKRYQATITLGFFEQIASNETIAGMLRDAGFSDVKVTGSGGSRVAEALWPGPDRTEAMPSQIVKVAAV